MQDSMTGNINILSDGVEDRAEEKMNDWVGEVQGYAQDNAPWQDITGDARNGLTAEVYTEGDDVILSLSHSVEYGQWLETIQSGRFAIIMPTLEAYAPMIFKDVGAHALGFGGYAI